MFETLEPFRDNFWYVGEESSIDVGLRDSRWRGIASNGSSKVGKHEDSRDESARIRGERNALLTFDDINRSRRVLGSVRREGEGNGKEKRLGFAGFEFESLS